MTSEVKTTIFKESYPAVLKGAFSFAAGGAIALTSLSIAASTTSIIASVALLSLGVLGATFAAIGAYTVVNALYLGFTSSDIADFLKKREDLCGSKEGMSNAFKFLIVLVQGVALAAFACIFLA